MGLAAGPAEGNLVSAMGQPWGPIRKAIDGTSVKCQAGDQTVRDKRWVFTTHKNMVVVGVSELSPSAARSAV